MLYQCTRLVWTLIMTSDGHMATIAITEKLAQPPLAADMVE